MVERLILYLILPQWHEPLNVLSVAIFQQGSRNEIDVELRSSERTLHLRILPQLWIPVSYCQHPGNVPVSELQATQIRVDLTDEFISWKELSSHIEVPNAYSSIW